jgi:hypothetical protein
VTRRSGRARSLTAGPAVSRRGCGDEGMVTAEFAVALPAFVVVLLAALCGVAVMTAQLRCVDAADVAARMAARGEPSSVVHATALSGAPGGAEIAVAASGAFVTATVSARLSLPGLSRFLRPFEVSAHVTEAIEPAGPASAG